MSKNQLIEIDTKQLDLARLMLQDVKNGLPRAIQGAINTSLTQARRDFYDAIRKEYTLQKVSSNHKEAISMSRASPANLSGSLRYRGVGIPLINFKVTPKRPARRNPHKVRVISEVHAGKAELWNHAFIAKMKTGHLGVFTRTGKFNQVHRVGKRRSGNVRRESIVQRFSTSIPAMIAYVEEHDPNLRDRLQKVAENKLNEQIIKILDKVNK